MQNTFEFYQLKYCSKCKKVKSLSEFYRQREKKDGHQSHCKVCRENYVKEHQDKYRKYKETYYQKNKKKCLERSAQWYKDNLDRSLKVCAQWKKNNPEKVAEYGYKRKARKKKTKGNFKAEDIERLKILQNYRCLCCGEKKILAIDHIIPLSKGGRNDITNLQGLCRTCNSKKFTKTIDYRSKGLKRKIFKQYDLFIDSI